MVETFAKISGDTNPIHLSDDYAKKTRFGKRIAHGMLVASFVSRVLGCYFPGEGTIFLKSEMIFLNPVYIGDIITIKVIVTEKVDDKSRLILKTLCKNQEGKIVMDGSALVLYNK